MLNPRKNIGKGRQRAIDENRTVFVNSVVSPKNQTVLKKAENNKKLGNGKSIITKGKWKGFPLYYLVIEQRKTCPTYCKHFSDCYGNSMPWATRYKHGKELKSKLREEIADLAIKYPKGFVIRPHVLGEFYSTKYVKFWGSMLNKYPNLNLFGYTARKNEPIYNELVKLVLKYKERFAFRFSQDRAFNPVTKHLRYASTEAFKGPSIICPEQQNKTDACITCGLCWSQNVTKTIKFLTH